MTCAESARLGATCAGSRTCVTPAAAGPHSPRPHQAPQAVSFADGSDAGLPPRCEGGAAAIAATRHHGLVEHDEHCRSLLASGDPRPQRRPASGAVGVQPEAHVDQLQVQTPCPRIRPARPAKPSQRLYLAPANVCDDSTRTNQPTASSPSMMRAGPADQHPGCRSTRSKRRTSREPGLASGRSRSARRESVGLGRPAVPSDTWALREVAAP